MFQEQGPQHVGSVLSLDLVGDDHLLHHLVGHPWQGLLVQVQKHSPWNKDGMDGPSSPGKKRGQGVEGRENQGRGGSQISTVQGRSTAAETRSRAQDPSPIMSLTHHVHSF